MPETEDNKTAAVDFLRMVTGGRIEEAYHKHVDMGGRHHNLYFPAGFPSLQKAMMENHVQFPNKAFAIKHVLGDGEFVAVHSHVILKPRELEVAVVHLFRFQGSRIAELWDCGQQVPADMPNKDGAF